MDFIPSLDLEADRYYLFDLQGNRLFDHYDTPIKYEEQEYRMIPVRLPIELIDRILFETFYEKLKHKVHDAYYIVTICKRFMKWMYRYFEYHETESVRIMAHRMIRTVSLVRRMIDWLSEYSLQSDYFNPMLFRSTTHPVFRFQRPLYPYDFFMFESPRCHLTARTNGQEFTRFVCGKQRWNEVWATGVMDKGIFRGNVVLSPVVAILFAGTTGDLIYKEAFVKFSGIFKKVYGEKCGILFSRATAGSVLDVYDPDEEEGFSFSGEATETSELDMLETDSDWERDLTVEE